MAGGHLTNPPTSMANSSIVSRNSVRMDFLIAAFNNVDILTGDIQNTYIHAETKENIYFIAGDGWKANKGRIVVVACALYSLKSSALQF